MALAPNHRLNTIELRSVMAAIRTVVATLPATSEASKELTMAHAKLQLQLDLLK